MRERRLKLRLAAAALAVLAWAAPALATDYGEAARVKALVGYGDGREYETSTPAFRGRTASAYIPPGMHIENEGGIDGAGLCVIASNVLDGVFQRVPELRDGKNSATWKAAKRAPGGA